MTTLISWLGVDSRAPSSIYLASDSRITWDSNQKWDVGRKLFASKEMPEIFGYSGDVFFPNQVLGQIVAQIDMGIFFSKKETYDNKLKKVHEVIEASFKNLPEQQQRSFEVIYASRTHLGMQCEFHISKIYLNKKVVSTMKIDLPPISDLITDSGSGKSTFRSQYNNWVESKLKDPLLRTRTSRNIFSAFCDSLSLKKDPLSGGAPQLIGLYRSGGARSFGIISEDRRYFNGQEVTKSLQVNAVEWRNSLFERCDGENMKIFPGAQRQPRPFPNKS